jgi:hypothetical protein
LGADVPLINAPTNLLVPSEWPICKVPFTGTDPTDIEPVVTPISPFDKVIPLNSATVPRLCLMIWATIISCTLFFYYKY